MMVGVRIDRGSHDVVFNSFAGFLDLAASTTSTIMGSRVIPQRKNLLVRRSWIHADTWTIGCFRKFEGRRHGGVRGRACCSPPKPVWRTSLNTQLRDPIPPLLHPEGDMFSLQLVTLPP